MSCGCSSARARREVLRTSQHQPSSDGGMALASYPNCVSLYSGPLGAESTFVIGRNTEHERLFKRMEVSEAMDYAVSLGEWLEVENIPNVLLCADAVEAVYA